MRQRHVAHAAGIQFAQPVQAVLNRVAPLQADQRGNFPLLVSGFDLVRGDRQNEILRMPFDNVVADRIDHLLSPIERPVPRTGIARSHPVREKHGTHAALAQPPQIGVSFRRFRPDIESAHAIDARFFGGDVVVRVDEQRRPVHTHHLGVGDFARLRRNHRRSEAENRNHSHSFVPHTEPRP